jgi:hypothetical protein
MNIRRLILFSFLFIAPRLFCAQENPGQEGPPFPLTLALEAVCDDGSWRPDWPLDMPPDAFTVKGAASRVSLDLEGMSYTLARDARGRLTDFPLVVPASTGSADGEAPVLAQVSVRYHAGGGIAGLSVRLSSSLTWTAQFPLPYIPGGGTPPARGQDAVKVQSGSQTYYVLFTEGVAEIAETWFDPWGEFIAYFTTRIEGAGSPWGVPWHILSQKGTNARRDYRYESGGNLSQYAGDEGQFSALYNAQQRPLYLVRALLSETRNYSFQWDEQGLLTRMRELSPEANAGEPLPVPVDFRYEYEFDARGNWILRREIALFRRDGLLLPASAREIKRQISYIQGE